jgi:hypothetical protein
MQCPDSCPMENKPVTYRDPPWRGGMTECPECEHIYVKWVNYREVLAVIGRTDEDVKRK